jgi:hypothetical protein
MENDLKHHHRGHWTVVMRWSSSQLMRLGIDPEITEGFRNHGNHTFEHTELYFQNFLKPPTKVTGGSTLA